MFDSGDGILRVENFSFFTPNEGYNIVAKQFNFCFIWPYKRRPEVFLFVQMSICKGHVGFCVPDLEKWRPPWSASMEPSSVQCPLDCLPWDVATSRAQIYQVGLGGDPWILFLILLASIGVTFGFRLHPLRFSTVWNLYFVIIQHCSHWTWKHLD